jgi:hypothetical protein
MIHSVLLVARGTETTLLSRFYGAAERSSALLQAQWLQSVRDATKARWGLARYPPSPSPPTPHRDAAKRPLSPPRPLPLGCVRGAGITRVCTARHGGGEQIAVCQDKCVVYAGTQELLVFVAGTDEYDELACENPRCTSPLLSLASAIPRPTRVHLSAADSGSCAQCWGLSRRCGAASAGLCFPNPRSNSQKVRAQSTAALPRAASVAVMTQSCTCIAGWVARTPL